MQHYHFLNSTCGIGDPNQGPQGKGGVDLDTELQLL